MLNALASILILFADGSSEQIANAKVSITYDPQNEPPTVVVIDRLNEEGETIRSWEIAPPVFIQRTELPNALYTVREKQTKNIFSDSF